MLKRAWSRGARLLCDERGMLNLPELLVAVPLMLAVFGATLGMYSITVRSQTRNESRVRTIIDQQVGMERMSRELRTATSVRYQTSEIVDAQLARNSRWVRYDCSSNSCRRSEGPTEGVFDQGPVVLVNSVEFAEFQLLVNAGNGDFQPNYVSPDYMVMKVRATVEGASNPIVLNDGFNLRNLAGAS